MISFLISRFEKAALSNLVKECFGSDFPDILTKPQVDYIYRYLADLGAKAVLLEPEYVDRDYLDDYAKFYSRQFSNRGHKCARLHFFSHDITHDSIEGVIAGDASDEETQKLKDHYLGFSVVRPLARTFIGRTCLKRYPPDKMAVQQITLSRHYDVSLFGLPLQVDSVAFQEQDKVVAACATTAIWSLLHAGTLAPVPEVPSLSRITQDAINFIPQSSNEFPNKELTTKQILRAIDVRGFRHAVHNASSQPGKWLMDTLQAYINSGIPALLVCRVGRIENVEDANNPEAELRLTDCGGHAVAVVGFKIGLGGERALFINDDRTGPFARASVGRLERYKPPAEIIPQRHSGGLLLELQQKDRDGWRAVHEVLIPTTVIAAMPRTVRVPIDAVERLGAHARNLLRHLVGNPSHSELLSLRQEMALRPINEIKQWLREEKDWASLNGDADKFQVDSSQLGASRLRFLTRNFARYQWVLDIFQSDFHVFRVLIDATDVPQGDAVSAVLYPGYSAPLMVKLTTELERAQPNNVGDDSSALKASFARRFRAPQAGISEYLERTFGALRAPKYIKTPEIERSRLTANESRTVFYQRSSMSLDQVFPSRGNNILIWVIDHEGALIIGIEQRGSDIGHPALTGSKPARIAGELSRDNELESWKVNAESGRYSRDYSNADQLLSNAIERMAEFFGHTGDRFEQAAPRER